MQQNTQAPNWTLTPYSGLQINTTAISDNGQILMTGTSAEYDSSSNFAVYCYSTDGVSATPLWTDPLGSDVSQGVFWVAVSGDGSQAAAGGQYGSGRGFLRTYSVSAGLQSKQEFPTSGRINEVEICQDGSNMVAVEGSNVHLLRLSGQQYTDQVTTVSNTYLRSCGVSDNGVAVVAAGELDSTDYQHEFVRGLVSSESYESTTGLLILYNNQADSLTEMGRFHAPAGILRTVISGSGMFFAASTKDGMVYLFETPQEPVTTLTPVWSYTPQDYSLGLTYALAIAHTGGEVFVGAGGNYNSTEEDTTDYGFAYMLQSTYDRTSNRYYGNRLWIYQLQYCPNPGMNMDAAAQWVTSADGQPIFNDQQTSSANSTPPQETPGNFYLFDARSGQLQWRYNTSLMNWPMAINSQGSAVFAASDNGTAYYWAPVTG
jgi:hypothetical protein